MEMMLDKTQIRAIFSSEFQMGHKAALTNFIDLLLAVLRLRCRTDFSLVAAIGGPSSSRGLLTAAASLAADRRH